MSHWHTGKISLKCSIGVLKRALINIVPKWEKYIKEDPSGKLVIKSGYSQPDQHGYHLSVPMSSETGVSGADLGFKLKEDGSWEITHDYLPPQLRSPEGQLTQEVASMRTRALAEIKGLEVVRDIKQGGNTVIEILVPAGQQEGLMA